MKVFLVTEADLSNLLEKFAVNAPRRIASVLGKSNEEFPSREEFKAASVEVRKCFEADIQDWIYSVTERRSL